MGDAKGFTSYFNLVDNFTAKFDAIHKRITSVTSDKYIIDFDVDNSAVLKQTQELGNKLEGSAAGISKAMDGTKVASKGVAETQKEVGKAVDQNVGITKKAGASISELQGKYEGLSSSISKLVGSFAAMATGGAIAGMSYLDAAKGANRMEDTIKAITGNRKNQVTEPKLNDYLNSYKGSGWTSAGKMSDTLQATYLFGGKNARGQKGLDLADAAEKIAYAKQDSLGGMSGGDLMRSATLIKGKLRPQMEGNFRIATANVQSLPGYESMIKTASGRLKLLKKEAETIKISAEMDRHPWAVAEQNIADFKKAIGESIAGPMASISRIIAGIAKAMKDVPGLAGLVGWGAILTSAAGAASLLISVFTPLYTVLSKLGVITKLQTAYEWASLTVKQAWFVATNKQTISSITLGTAERAEAISVIGSNVAANEGIGTRLQLAAANIYNTAATKTMAVAHWAFAGIEWALVASTNALAAVYGLLTGRIVLSTIATKTMAMATVISRAATVATIGIMAALSAVYGVLTGDIGLSTIATWAGTSAMVVSEGASSAFAVILGVLAAAETIAAGGALALAAGIWAALAPLLPFIAAGALVAGILALVATKAGLLGPILKGLGSINLGKVFKDLGKGDLGKAWHDLTKGFKLPSLAKMWDNLTSDGPDFGKMFGGLKEWVGGIFSNISVGGIIQGITGKGPEEILQIIADQMRVMLRWVSTNIAPVTSKIHDILKKVQSIFEWLYDLFQRFWNWIQQAMPGAAKETKRQEIEKAVSKENSADKTKALSFDTNTGKYSVRDLTVNAGTSHTLTEKDYGEEKYNKLTKKASEYMGLPGFAEGIAQAVAKGISGIGTQIADAIKGLILEIPGVKEMAQAIKDLQTWLEGLDLGNKATDLGNKVNTAASNVMGTNPSQYATQTATRTISGVGKLFKNGEDNYDILFDTDYAANPDNNVPMNPLQGITSDDAKRFGFAAGATFTREGLFSGKVHAPEELIPQSISQRGPGPIAKALDLLNNVTAGGKMSSAIGTGVGGDIHVHMPSQDFSGMKISSNVDFERLLRDANKKAVEDAVLEIKKQIGQRRT